MKIEPWVLMVSIVKILSLNVMKVEILTLMTLIRKIMLHMKMILAVLT